MESITVILKSAVRGAETGRTLSLNCESNFSKPLNPKVHTMSKILHLESGSKNEKT